MEWLLFFEKSLWFGFGAIGFAVLFNVPARTLFVIGILGAIGGTIKIVCMHYGLNVITATLLGATTVGVLSIWTAYNKNAPPLVFSIPSIIPMIPGVFIYKMILGVIALSGDIDTQTYTLTLAQTVNYASKVIFIIISIAVGVSMPLLIIRQTASKNSKFQHQ